MNMLDNVCHIDIESYSECNLKKSGLYKYADHDTTEISVACYTWGAGNLVDVWIPWGIFDWQWDEYPQEIVDRLEQLKIDEPERRIGEIIVSAECPEDLARHAEKGGQFRAHNSNFERVMLTHKVGQRIGFPSTKINQWVCTAAKAAAHSLPRALENAASALDTHRKDKVGKGDMLAICKPRTGKEKRYTPFNAPDRHFNVIKYCVDDVLAEVGIDLKIPDLSKNEQKVFELDQLINDRGVRIDEPAIEDVQVLIAQYKVFLENRCRDTTGGLKPSQTEKIANWVRDQGYACPNLQAPTMKEALADPDCPEMVKRVLSIRLLHSMKAVSKYDSMQRAVSGDGRLHGMFLYHGAGTGRWSSMIVQLQNLFRPVIKDPENAIAAFEPRELEWIRELFTEDPMKVFASCVRGMLIPSIGKDLLAMDYASIEARVTGWVAGQEDMLDVFRDHGKLYEFTAAKIYGTSVEVAVLKAMKNEYPDRRFVGKIAVLALGYQGGRKAFAKMAKTYGVDIEEERAEQIKVDWRKANPKIVQLWYDMEESAIAAVANPGTAFAIPNKKIMFKVEGDFLYMRLPSGRRLAYFKPLLDGEGKLTYLGIDTYSRRWMRCKTYGGKLTENAIQAISRDLLAAGMFRLEAAGYEIIGTVHDEVITEVLEGFGSEKEVADLLCILPKWAVGLPVKAEGFRGKRYRK